MTRIIAGTKTEFSIDPAILELLPAQGSVELQRDAAGKVHPFHTHPVDEILVIISGRLNFIWEGGEKAFNSRRLSTVSLDGAPSLFCSSATNVGFFISHLQ